MDIASIIGIVLAWGVVVGAILMAGSLGTFIDVPSLVLVGGGTLAASFMCFPLGRVFSILKVCKKMILTKPPDPVRNVLDLIKLAEVARRDGILSLEAQLASGQYDTFLVRGLRMAIDGQDPSVISAAMEQEVDTLAERHGAGKSLFDNMSKYAPAFGMIGTLVGLVLMLKNLSDPATLGPSMAVALITTFYGSVISNMISGPVADKLAYRSGEEISGRMLVIRGVMSIQAGDNPRIVQQKLMAFLDSGQRKRVEAAAG